ncbi:MAG: (4Fe-4S)-binding protein [Planctomycetota bacterium]|nr:(4Fe-4S)-binding protein [Planctomycetota bacterium]
MARKTYRGSDLDVSFDLETCIHAGECVRSLPKVFDTERRPWILPDEASADEVRDLVGRCPSGALEVIEHGAEGAAEAAAPTTTIRMLPGGPFMVDGPFRVLGEDGEPIDHGSKAALCRCGKSASSPFCDGSHAKA